MAIDGEGVKHPSDSDQGMETLFDMVARSLNRKLDQAIDQAIEKLDVLRENVSKNLYGDRRSTRD